MAFNYCVCWYGRWRPTCLCRPSILHGQEEVRLSNILSQPELLMENVGTRQVFLVTSAPYCEHVPSRNAQCTQTIQVDSKHHEVYILAWKWIRVCSAITIYINDHRASELLPCSPRSLIALTPYQLALLYICIHYHPTVESVVSSPRPYKFWQWNSYSQYIEFLAGYMYARYSISNNLGLTDNVWAEFFWRYFSSSLDTHPLL